MAKTKAEFDGAAAGDIAPIEDPIVSCRVLKRGDGKISTGVHHVRGGEELYEFGETFSVPRSVADALEARDFVEISEVVPTKAPRKASVAAVEGADA